MDLLRHARHVLADQFQVTSVDGTLLCVLGPFHFADGQPIEVYLQETAHGLELIYYPGLAEALTLEALHELRDEDAEAASLRGAEGLELRPDRLGLRSGREELLEDLIGFFERLQALDRRVRERRGRAT